MKAKVRLNKYKNNSVTISGSKNSSLPIIAASLLCDDDVIIYNVPNISDINKLIKIIKKIGFDITFHNNTVRIKHKEIYKKKFYFQEIKQLRGSYYLIGTLIGKSNYCDFSFLYPGGCKFGYRPIDFHLKAFKKMGICNYSKGNKLFFKGYKTNCIHDLKYPSVGATINIILASCKMNKQTIITNASIEPEVIDVCNFLNSMGTEIVINKRTIVINGNNHLHSTEYTVMGDRIEAGTFLILGAIHNGITITNIKKDYLLDIINLLSSIGCCFEITDKYIKLYKINKILKPFDISLSPYPGIPTDLGPILSVLASQCEGLSTINDLVYSDRTTHIKELQKMNITISNINNKILEQINSNSKVIVLGDFNYENIYELLPGLKEKMIAVYEYEKTRKDKQFDWILTTSNIEHNNYKILEERFDHKLCIAEVILN